MGYPPRVGPAGPQGPEGPQGPQGIQGVPGVNSFGAPNPRSLNVGTVYQATDTTKPAVVTLNINSTATLTLGGANAVTGEARIGASSTGLAAGTSGTAVGPYRNSLAGLVIVGVSLNADGNNQITLFLPAGWFFVMRQTAGTITIISAFDQAVG